MCVCVCVCGVLLPWGQVYEEYAEQADTWLASKEAFLANEDLGVSHILAHPYIIAR